MSCQVSISDESNLKKQVHDPKTFWNLKVTENVKHTVLIEYMFVW